MLSWFFLSLQSEFSFLNVFRYISFRSGLAALTSLLVIISWGPSYIRWIRRKQYGQAVRDDGPKSHLSKQGTPTMGGVMIIVGLAVGTFLWADLSSPYIWWLLGLTGSFGLVGYLDDYLKVVKKDPRGLASRWKFRAQYLFSVIAAVVLYRWIEADWSEQGRLFFPFFKNYVADLGPWYMLLAIITIVGASNAVNLTDGLDGLAIGPIIINTASFFVICYLMGNFNFSTYLQIPFVPGLGEVAVFCAAASAAGIAFLWFNSYPAQIFMGDVGALALGAAIGGLALISKSEILLVILGGVFVIETVSVMMQVASFKILGRRVFRMAPIHHHFELGGMPEPKIIVRFWIVSLILALLALSTLKIR